MALTTYKNTQKITKKTYSKFVDWKKNWIVAQVA